jgi:Putative adhesin
MPTYDSPTPIAARVEVARGEVRLVAADRTDTVVEVRPRDPSDPADVAAADGTTVEFADGRLTVAGPREHGTDVRPGAIDVRVDLPTGSAARVDAAAARVTAEGRLGEARVRTASGDVRLDETGPARVDTASGDVTLGRVGGEAHVTAMSGDVDVTAVDGPAVVRSASGRCWVGEVAGDLRMNAAGGHLAVDRAGGRSVVAKTANGSVRLGDVGRGNVVVQTASGAIEVGVREGTAAWLDVRSLSGRVRSTLDPADGPAASDETVQVRARTASGDILVRRA